MNSGNSEDSKYGIYGCATVFKYVDLHKDIIAIDDKYDIKINKPLLMKIEHDRVIGTWDKCYMNKYGLFVEGHISSTYKRLSREIALGKVGLSIGFYPVKFKKIRLYGQVLRLIYSLHIVEVSLTSRPANDKCICLLNKICTKFLMNGENNEF